MFSVFSFIVLFKWVSEHLVEVLIGLAIFIFIIVRIARRGRVNRSSASAPAVVSRPVPPPAPVVPAPVSVDPDPSPSVSFPSTFNNKNRAYFYEDVKIVPVPDGAGFVVPGESLTFTCSDESVKIYQGAHCIGEMVENRLAGMVRDWEKAGDPVLSYVLNYEKDGSAATIGLAFYQDLLTKYLQKNPGAKSYKLAGRPDDLAFGYVPGSLCSVESDFDDPEKYNVVFDGSSIGRLPASAIRYAEEEGYSPDDLRVIVSSVDYDVEKDRDIISVYIE